MKSNTLYIRFISSLAALLILCPGSNSLWAQYHPAANQPGTSAIHRDSSVFIDWGDTLHAFERGWMNISDTSLGKVNYGDSIFALNTADGSVVSLGDKGFATIGFSTPLANGPGWDFAVFENAFDHYFLELAFVEVSSDGIHFVRFPAASLTSTDAQKGSFDTISPHLINNLAGKYQKVYGTPFDLQELKDSANLDLNNIRYIRIVDVCGSITDSVASYDADNRKINEPFPTEFASGGFDLDAVGVIHNQTNTGITKSFPKQSKVYPMPADEQLHIQSDEQIMRIRVYSISGRCILDQPVHATSYSLKTTTLASGFYILVLGKQTSGERHKILITH